MVKRPSIAERRLEEGFSMRGTVASCTLLWVPGITFRGYEQRRLCLKGSSPNVKGLVCVLMQFETVLFPRTDNLFLWFGIYVLEVMTKPW